MEKKEEAENGNLTPVHNQPDSPEFLLVKKKQPNGCF